LKKTDEIYSAAFTAGGLLYRETLFVLDLLLHENAEELLTEEVENNKYIRINSQSARQRSLQEIRKRNIYTDNIFWKLFKESDEEQQRLMLFYLCIKAYKLVFDFHFNVTLPKWKINNHVQDSFYYKMRLDEIAMSYTEVDSWTSTTQTKVITVYLRMIKESGFVKNNSLSPVSTESSFWEYFIRKKELWFLEACFFNKVQRDKIIKEFK